MASLSNRAIQKIAIRRIQNSKTRSVFMGIVILFATMILAFIASYGTPPVTPYSLAFRWIWGNMKLSG